MDIESKILELKNEYVSELPGHISSIYQYWERFLDNPADQEALDCLLNICHNLAGTGASFGFPLLSHHTREIERCLRPAIDINRDIDSQNLIKISDLISGLNMDCKLAS